MILIDQFFHMSNGTTYVAGVKRKGFHFPNQCYFDLYAGSEFIDRIKVESVVMAHSRPPFDPGEHVPAWKPYELITVWVEGHLDKKMIEGKTNTYLILSVEGT